MKQSRHLSLVRRRHPSGDSGSAFEHGPGRRDVTLLQQILADLDQGWPVMTHAALELGMTFDQAFLTQWGVVGFLRSALRSVTERLELVLVARARAAIRLPSLLSIQTE